MHACMHTGKKKNLTPCIQTLNHHEWQSGLFCTPRYSWQDADCWCRLHTRSWIWQTLRSLHAHLKSYTDVLQATWVTHGISTLSSEMSAECLSVLWTFLLSILPIFYSRDLNIYVAIMMCCSFPPPAFSTILVAKLQPSSDCRRGLPVILWTSNYWNLVSVGNLIRWLSPLLSSSCTFAD